MECNRDEAARSKEIAERKLIEKDFAGAKKFAMKAHNLYPRMDGIFQLLATIDVYVFSGNKINGEADWYEVLGVNPVDSEDTIRKQYRKLVLMLHPDKNKAQGADGAFILVSQAWDVLSDKTRRLAYDKKISLDKSRHNIQPQCGGSSAPPAHNDFCNSKNGSNVSNMKAPKGNCNSVPTESHRQKPVSTDPLSSPKEKRPTAHAPRKRASSRKEKPPTVPPPCKNASSSKEKPPTVPPIRKHASSSKEKPATVPPPHKHKPSVVSPSSYKPNPDNTSVSSHKETPPSVPSPHNNKPSTIPDSSCEQKPSVTPLSSHKERPQTVHPTHKYNPSTSTVHASSHKQEPSTMHASSQKQKLPMASVSANKEKVPVVPPSKKPKPSNIPASCHKQKPPTGPVSSHNHKPGRVAASSREEKPPVVPVTSPKRKRVPGIPDQPKDPKQTAGFLSRCNGCKMQFEYPRINTTQSMICPKCYKLVFYVKIGC